MYRPAAYVVDDLKRLHATIRAYPFATIACARAEAVMFAYAPVVLDTSSGPFGTLRFHLARANPVADVGDVMLHFSFRGPDAYVSPDWYEGGAFVPTWNYIAVEASGRPNRVDPMALEDLLVALSAEQEEQLRPKSPWRIEKISKDRIATLLQAIVGFEVKLETLQGKFKLSQEKGRGDIEGVVAGLEGTARARSTEVARAMRQEQGHRGR